MSDPQQSLPRYFGKGPFGPVAGALNLHADCIERLDEGLSVHTGSGSYIKSSGGTAFSRQRMVRGTTQNNYGDCKRFAMRIAKDTDGTVKLFVGEGGVQIETATASSRIELAETKKDPITDGIVYIDYVQEGGTATIEYETSISPTAGHYYVRIGKTPKHVDATDKWALPEQWLTTDAYLLLQGDSRVDDIIDVLPPDPVVTRDDGTPETKPDGTPVRSFADDYSFRCRVAKDGTTWKIHVSDGIVHGRGLQVNYEFSSVGIPATVVDAPTSSKDLFLVVTKTVAGSEITTSAEFVLDTGANAYGIESVTRYEESTIDAAGPITTTSTANVITAVSETHRTADAVTQVSPETRMAFVYTLGLSTTSAPAVISSITSETVYPLSGFVMNTSATAKRVFRLASVTVTNGVPSLVQRQFGDISADFDSRIGA